MAAHAAPPVWWLAPLLVVMVGWVSFYPSLVGPFTFDDHDAILENRTIRQLWPIWPVLKGIDETAVAGRPLVNLSLAFNYALGEYEPWGYHIFNVLLHLVAGCTLWGIARRTLQLPQWPERVRGHATLIALALALIWVAHPLHTETVAYVMQRTELLVSVFYLLTLYTAIRALDSTLPWAWQSVSIVCCFLGVLSKEVMVSAPLAVVLYDIAFRFPTWRAALQRRWSFYLGLFSSWMVLGALLWTGPRQMSVGFNLEISALEYLQTQCYVILHYLSLAVWPDPGRLTLDYGTWIVEWPYYLPGLIVLLVLAGVTIWGWWRRPWIGFLGTWFFMILAPSSSFVPIVTEVAAERRMYLPLVAPLAIFVVLAVFLGGVLLDRLVSWAQQRQRWAWGSAIMAMVLVTIALGVLTRERLHDYRDELTLWQDTVEKRPDNHRAWVNYGKALKLAGQIDAAGDAFRRSIREQPNYALAHNNLGVVLTEQGQIEEAVNEYTEALRLKPDYPQALNNLAVALIRLNRIDEAESIMKQVLAASPDDAQAVYNMSSLMTDQGEDDTALVFLLRTVELSPDSAEAHNNLGVVLAKKGNTEQALKHLGIAMELSPGEAEIVFNYGNTLASAGRYQVALPYIRRAIELDSSHSKSHNTLAVLLSNLGDNEQAEKHLQASLEADENNLEARLNLAVLLAGRGALREAETQLIDVLRRDPNNAPAQQQLMQLRKAAGVAP